MILSDAQAAELILKPYGEGNIRKAKELRASSLVHFTGDGFDSLFNQLIGVESATDANLKKAIGKQVTKEIVDYIYFEQNQWRTAPGKVRSVDFGKGLTAQAEWDKVKAKIWKGSDLETFTTRWLSKAMYTGFNDFILIEKPQPITNSDDVIYEGLVRPKSDVPKYYICHKSITEVRDYRKTGDRVEYLILNYGKKKIGTGEFSRFRVIDDTSDRIFIQQDKTVTVDPDEPVLKHNEIPVRQIGSVTERIENDNVCVSPIDPVIPLLDLHLSYYAIWLVSDAKNSYPVRWMWGGTCHTCKGSGNVFAGGSEKICPDCGGTGLKATLAPGHTFLIPPQTEGNEIKPMTGDPAGVVETDIATPEYQKKTIYERKREIILSALGSSNVVEDSINKTATETMMNAAPLQNRNNVIAELNEAVEKWITEYVCKQISAKDYRSCTVRYGRKLNLRNEDTILKEIEQAKKTGASSAYVMSLLEEMIHTKFRNDPAETERQLTLMSLEPLPGYTIDEVTARPFVTDVDKLLKQYFTQVISTIERKAGAITKYVDSKGADVVRAELTELAQVMQEKKEPMLATLLGVGGTQAMQAILSDVNITEEQKKGILKVLFQLSDEQINLIFNTNQS